MKLTPLVVALFSALGGEEIDWKRDRIVLVDGREQRGVVVEAFDPERILLMTSAGHREEIPRAKIQRVELLRERLAAYLKLRKPGLSLSAEWALVEAARAVGLERTARLQAYRVLTLDPEHAGAHEFLDHSRAGGHWKWKLDGKRVSRERFEALSTDWDHRLILDSEHFRLETDCGLARALDVLFDLESVYVWWMQHLGPELRPSEDVDDPSSERITFEVYQNRDDLLRWHSSVPEPYYVTARTEPNEDLTEGTFNVVRTYYTPKASQPERLFQLATESFVYSLLVLGKSLTRAVDEETRRPSYWVERGLGEWVAQHCGGKPGYVEIREPFQGNFVLDATIGRQTLEPIDPPHPLLRNGREEMKRLIMLTDDSLWGTDANVPRARARATSFVAFLIEVDPQVIVKKKARGSGRPALWTYLREVYGTSRVFKSDAFDAGLGGEVEELEAPWKAWTQTFLAAPAPAK